MAKIKLLYSTRHILNYLAVYDTFPPKLALNILFGTKTEWSLASFSFGK